MAKAWRMIRVPVELANRLDRLTAELEESHVLGRTRLPNQFCEGVPLHYVIERGLDELEGHRKRSRRATSDSPAA